MDRHRRIFGPCTRHRDRLGELYLAQRGPPPKHGRRIANDRELIRLGWLDTSIAEYCLNSWVGLGRLGVNPWMALTRPLRKSPQNVLLWISPNAVLTAGPVRGLTDRVPYTTHGWFRVQVKGQTSSVRVQLWTVTPDEPTEDWKRLLEIMARCSIETVFVRTGVRGMGNCTLSACMLSYLFETLGSDVEVSFLKTVFSIEQSQALAPFRGSLELDECLLHDKGRSLFHSIAQNRGPTGLSFCNTDMSDASACDSSALFGCLRRTNSLQSLSFKHTVDLDLGQLCEAVGKANGLKEFSVRSPQERVDGSTRTWILTHVLREAAWFVAVRSLLRNPTLENISLMVGIIVSKRQFDFSVEDRVVQEQHRQRTRFIADLMKVNKDLRQLDMLPEYFDQRIWKKSIQRYLKANTYRKRIKAALEGVEMSQRGALMSEILSAHEVKHDPMWMSLLVSGFRDLVVVQLSKLVEEDSKVSKENEASVAPGPSPSVMDGAVSKFASLSVSEPAQPFDEPAQPFAFGQAGGPLTECSATVDLASRAARGTFLFGATQTPSRSTASSSTEGSPLVTTEASLTTTAGPGGGAVNGTSSTTSTGVGVKPRSSVENHRPPSSSSVAEHGGPTSSPVTTVSTFVTTTKTTDAAGTTTKTSTVTTTTTTTFTPVSENRQLKDTKAPFALGAGQKGRSKTGRTLRGGHLRPRGMNS